MRGEPHKSDSDLFFAVFSELVFYFTARKIINGLCKFASQLAVTLADDAGSGMIDGFGSRCVRC